MELSNIECKTYYLDSKNLTLQVETTADIDFDDGLGPERMQSTFDYVPTEWPEDEIIIDHSGQPQEVLITWLKVYFPNRTDWETADDDETFIDINNTGGRY